MTIPIALSIAGSDSGGGAGIQADLKTFSALEVYGATVITALTAQNTREVRAIYPVTATFVSEQIDAVCEDIRVDAVKVGMLNDVGVIEAVADGLTRHRLRNVVIDPVMVAKSGDRLLADNAVEALREVLLPHARVITPNLPEAGVLAGRAAPVDIESMRALGRELAAKGDYAVLMKGGHLDDDRAIDVMIDKERISEFANARLHTRNTHGTGCSLSAAIAANLAHQQPLEDAVGNASRWLHGAIAHADQLDVGRGHGPVHHFHQLWTST